MKAFIDARGLMTVKAETPTEAWALKTWSETALIRTTDVTNGLDHHYWRGHMLLIDASEPEDAK